MEISEIGALHGETCRFKHEIVAAGLAGPQIQKHVNSYETVFEPVLGGTTDCKIVMTNFMTYTKCSDLLNEFARAVLKLLTSQFSENILYRYTSSGAHVNVIHVHFHTFLS